MRRLMIAAALVALTGCDNVRNALSSHANTAAEAGDLELSTERLASLITGPKGMRPNRDAAQFVANVWVDYALFAQAVVNGSVPTDSAGMAEALWPEIAELKGTHWHDTLMARRGEVPDGAADSLYRSDSIRVLQHILFGVQPSATPEVRNAARAKAEQTLARIRRGADFGELAAQFSDDPGSRGDRGFLPPSPRGRFVAAFDSAGWALAPGATSGIVETPFGYHIIRRPTADAVRDRLNAYIVQAAGARLDSIYMDSLAIRARLEVRKDAPATMRSAAINPEAYRRATTKLVTFDGGALTVQDYLRWVRALPPAYTTQLRQADDSMLKQFARVLTQNTLLLREADSAGVGLDSLEWLSLRQRYLATIDTLKMEMGLGADATDSTIAESERIRVAEMKVQQYFDNVVAQKARLRPLPSALGQVLRTRMHYRINESGLGRSVELAQAAVKRDSTAQGPMQRAPGGPPIPGGAPQEGTASQGASPATPAPAPDSAARNAGGR